LNEESEANKSFPAFFLAPSEAPEAQSSSKNSIDLAAQLANFSPQREPARFDDLIKLNDPLLYIYTSGTTGFLAQNC